MKKLKFILLVIYSMFNLGLSAGINLNQETQDGLCDEQLKLFRAALFQRETWALQRKMKANYIRIS